jgi:hypothetical protein
MKIYLFAILLFIPILLQAQQDSSTSSSILNKKNEIQFDIGKLLISSRIQLTYERFLNKDFSTGISVMSLNKNREQNKIFYSGTRKYQIEPFVRYSLSKKTNRYFYAEVFASINGGEKTTTKRLIDSNNYGFYQIAPEKYTDLALGSAIGYKVYIKQTVSVAFNLGIGKNLFSKLSPDVVSRVGLNLGYRF